MKARPKFKRIKLKDFNLLKHWANNGLQWEIGSIIGCRDQPNCKELLQYFKDMRKYIKEL